MKPLYTLQRLTILLILVTAYIDAQILTEDFESGTFPPADWVTFRGVNDIGPNNDWEITTDAHTGSSAAFSRYSDPGIGIAEDWLVTPLLDLTNIDNATLTFFEKETEGSVWLSQYEIRVSTNSQTNHNDFVNVVTYNDLSLNYQENIIELGNYDGQQIYIAFVHTDEYQDNWLIDDVSVTGNATFTTTWQTTTANESITIPTDVNETYDYSVEWGDGNTTVEHTGNASHMYSTPGTYDVKITELFPRISFLGMPQEECDKLIDIKQWGDNPWTSMRWAFINCTNLQISATDAPNLSNVTHIDNMFNGASSFNQPINHWDVSNVSSMVAVFGNASIFNQPLDNWDVSNVTDMRFMFSNASAFNQSLNSWNVSNIILMSGLFKDATSFNQPLNTWDTSNINTMNSIFENATSFNQPLDTWSTANVTSMGSLFKAASSFNQPLNSWDVSNVTNMNRLFESASSFNQPLDNWNTSSVNEMIRMFHISSSFNQPLDTWDTSNVNQMSFMFRNAAAFNQSLNNWVVGNVTDMSRLFENAPSFNQPLDNWDTSSVNNMLRMFSNATSFNQSLDTWNVGNVTDMTFMLSNTNLSVEHYDATLMGWAALPSLQNNVSLWAESIYCNGEAARDVLINTYNWSITDGGLDCSTLSTNETALHKLSLYPNPAKGYISIKNLNTAEHYSIYDVLGKQVDSGQLMQGSEIQVSNLEKGIYFLKLDNYKTLRFLKN